MTSMPPSLTRLPLKGNAASAPVNPKAAKRPNPQLAHPATRNPGRKAPRFNIPEKLRILRLVYAFVSVIPVIIE